MRDHDNDDQDKKVGYENAMTPTPAGPSLDWLAEDVRSCCVREAAAADEHNILRRLAEEARERYMKLQYERENAERTLRHAYNEAVTP